MMIEEKRQNANDQKIVNDISKKVSSKKYSSSNSKKQPNFRTVNKKHKMKNVTVYYKKNPIKDISEVGIQYNIVADVEYKSRKKNVRTRIMASSNKFYSKNDLSFAQQQANDNFYAQVHQFYSKQIGRTGYDENVGRNLEQGGYIDIINRQESWKYYKANA